MRRYLEFVGRARGLQGDTLRQRLAWAVHHCGLQPMYRKLIKELSKGYRQRVGLAQALIHDPQVVVLDEPTSGLDPHQILEMRGLIRQLAADKTMLLSTHILQEVEAVADRLVIINNGRIVGDGTLRDLQQKTQRYERALLAVAVAREEAESALRDLPQVTQVRFIREVDGFTSFEIHATHGRPCATPNWRLSERQAVAGGRAPPPAANAGGSLSRPYRTSRHTQPTQEPKCGICGRFSGANWPRTTRRPIGYIFMIVFLSLSVGLFMTPFFTFLSADMRGVFRHPADYHVYISASSHHAAVGGRAQAKHLGAVADVSHATARARPLTSVRRTAASSAFRCARSSAICAFVMVRKAASPSRLRSSCAPRTPGAPLRRSAARRTRRAPARASPGDRGSTG